MTYLLDHYILDWWSLAHLVGWGVAAYVATRLAGLAGTTVLLLALLSGLSWEVLESSLVRAHALYDEPWANRWVADILIDLAGAMAGWRLARARRSLLQHPQAVPQRS